MTLDFFRSTMSTIHICDRCCISGLTQKRLSDQFKTFELQQRCVSIGLKQEKDAITLGVDNMPNDDSKYIIFERSDWERFKRELNYREMFDRTAFVPVDPVPIKECYYPWGG